MKIRTQHYNHHPEYVAKVQDEFIDYLNHTFNLNLSNPIIEKNIIKRNKRSRQDEGITLRITLREKHNNNLTLKIDTSTQCTWCSNERIGKTRNLAQLFQDFNFYPNP